MNGGGGSIGASGNLESDYELFDLIYTKTGEKRLQKLSSLLELQLHEQKALTNADLVTLHDARRSVSVHHRSLYPSLSHLSLFITLPVFWPHRRYFIFLIL